MAFRDPVGMLEDQRLRRVQAGEIGRAPSVLRPVQHVEQVLRLSQRRARFFKKGAALLFHKSMPSARMAYINGMRGSL